MSDIYLFSGETKFSSFNGQVIVKRYLPFFVDRLLKFGLGCVIEKIKKGVIDAILVGK